MPHSELLLQDSAPAAENVHHKQLSNDVPVSTSCTITLAAEAPAAFAENLERLLAILDPENGFTQVQTKRNQSQCCLHG